MWRPGEQQCRQDGRARTSADGAPQPDRHAILLNTLPFSEYETDKNERMIQIEARFARFHLTHVHGGHPNNHIPNLNDYHSKCRSLRSRWLAQSICADSIWNGVGREIYLDTCLGTEADLTAALRKSLPAGAHVDEVNSSPATIVTAFVVIVKNKMG